MSKRISLYNDDCFNILKKLEKRSIDLFILDLPYAQTSCSWDSLIDLEEMWKQIKRTMKKDAVIVFFCSTKFGYKLIKSNERWFRYDLVWEKSKKVGFLSANKCPLRKHEMIYIFKNVGGTYNPQKTKGKPYKTKAHNNAGYYYKDSQYERTANDNKGDRHPHSIIKEDLKEDEKLYNDDGTKAKGSVYGDFTFKHNTKTRSDSKGVLPRHPHSIINEDELEDKDSIILSPNPHKSVHRTQKPVSLVEWLIKTYSNENDLVVDFCMGSGTTGEACSNTKRRFIGVEKDEEIFNIAEKRLSKLDIYKDEQGQDENEDEV
mgnify:CR=1 FL=1